MLIVLNAITDTQVHSVTQCDVLLEQWLDFCKFKWTHSSLKCLCVPTCPYRRYISRSFEKNPVRIFNFIAPDVIINYNLLAAEVRPQEVVWFKVPSYCPLKHGVCFSAASDHIPFTFSSEGSHKFVGSLFHKAVWKI